VTITFEQALALCRSDPEAAARLICELSARVDAQQRQIEIEKVVVFKEEHRSYPVWCERCRKVHYHPFPEAVVKEGLFKERLTALVTYMKAVDHASFSTIRKFVRDVMGEKVSRGYLRKVVAIHQRDEGDLPAARQAGPLAFQRALEQARDRILEVALGDVPSRLDEHGKELKREAFNMAKRFRENGKADFEFITTPGIGPTHNLAEQAVRFVVIDRRITQGTRSLKGRETCERLWTVVGTCAMQGRSAFEFILAAVRAYFRGEPAPSLLPALG